MDNSSLTLTYKEVKPFAMEYGGDSSVSYARSEHNNQRSLPVNSEDCHNLSTLFSFGGLPVDGRLTINSIMQMNNITTPLCKASTSGISSNTMEINTALTQSSIDEAAPSDEMDIIDITDGLPLGAYNLAPRKFTCRYCGKQYSCNAARWQHENTKHREKAMIKKIIRQNTIEQRRQGLIGYECRFCAESCPTAQSRYLHEKTRHELMFKRRQEDTKKQRMLNKMRTDLSNEIRKSVAVTERQPTKKLRCHLCPKKFEKANHLRLHLSSHRTERPFVCQRCGRSFKAVAHLKKHVIACDKHANDADSVTDGNQAPEVTGCGETNQHPIANDVTANRNLAEEVVSQLAAERELNSQDELSPNLRLPQNLIEQEDILAGKEEMDIIRAESSPDWEKNSGTRTVDQTKSNIDVAQPDNAATFNSDDDNQESDNARQMEIRTRRESTSKTDTTFQKWDHIVFDAPLSEESNIVESTTMPLSAVIYTRAMQNLDEMIVVYLRDLEIDVVSAAHSFSDRCVLVLENLNLFKLTEQIYQLVKGFNPQMVNITLQKSLDSISIWSIVTFGDKPPPQQLNNRLVQNVHEIEDILTSLAESRQLKITNVIRYDKDGLYQYLSNRLSQKVVACNFAG